MFLFVGMNFGIDFAGGTQVDMRAKSGDAHIAEIRAKAESLGLGPVEVQRIGADSRRPAAPQRAARRRRRASRRRSPKLRDAFSDDYEFRSVDCGRPDASRPNWCRAARSASSSRSSRF